jgi:hypothetical protein
MRMRAPDDWSAIQGGGNILKFGLSIIVIFFDVVFILQHYLFYPDRTDPALDYAKVRTRSPPSPTHRLEHPGLGACRPPLTESARDVWGAGG